jgi:hypothetical protein
MIKKLQKHQKIFLYSIILVAAISFLDITFMNSGLFANTICDYINGNYVTGLWDLFFKLGISLIILSSFGYYLFRKDLSEALSIGISATSLWILFGLGDLLFFWFQRLNVPASLTWLDKGLVGKISSFIGFSTVTNISLYLLVAIGLLLNYFLIKLLVKKF